MRNSGLKPISNGLAAERRVELFFGLADVLGDRPDGELALAELQAQRRVLLGQQADAPGDREQLGAVELDGVVEALGQELAVVGELAVDQARRDPDVADREERLVFGDDEAQLAAVDGRAEALHLGRAP